MEERKERPELSVRHEVPEDGRICHVFKRSVYMPCRDWVSHAPRRPPPRPACCGPASELGCSSCFIRPLERVRTRAGSTRGDWSRLGTKPAILVGSWIAGVGAELDHGRRLTLYLGRAGRLSTPTGVWIKRGVKSPVGFGAGVASGRITRSSWER